MRRALLAITLVVTMLAPVTGCAENTLRPGSPNPPAVTTSAVALIPMPNLVGQNAAVAADKLKKLGFTNVDLGTVDGRPAVVIPQNWTVKTQSAKPGEQLPADAKIVLGCARNG